MSAMEELLAELSKMEPHFGWTDVSQVRSLSDQEIAICLSYYPDLVDEGMDTARIVKDLLVKPLSEASSPLERSQVLGQILKDALAYACREWLLGELSFLSLKKEMDRVDSRTKKA